MTPLTTLLAARAALVVAVAVGATFSTSDDASAVSLRVKLACASDYYAHCSQHAPDSPGVRQCMRAHGPQLSSRCVNALVAAGETTKPASQSRIAVARN